MKNFIRKSIVLVLLVLINLVVGDNDDVLVLVHGLGGSIETFEYIPELERSGLRVVPTQVHPYTSNHDRACELYAQLKGVIVDYGVCHSREQGHLRFGTDYTGKALLDNWDSNNKIHLMGHSMGGTTIRSLERLLAVGNDCSEDTSELFNGGNDWITSVTTLTSPLDGTTVFDVVGSAEEFLLNLFISLSADLEDLTFAQWGLVPGVDESYDDYVDRLSASGLFDEEDFSKFDLSVVGAERFNNAGQQIISPERFYFSFAAERTNPEEKCTGFICRNVEIPDSEMSFTLKPTSSIIGRLSGSDDRPNDGIVNQQRARCPGNKNCKEVADGSFRWSAGQWHTIMIDYLDHYQVTDRDRSNDSNNFEKSALKLYLDHAVRLKSLPSKSTSLSRSESLETTRKKQELQHYLKAVNALSNMDVEEEDSGISKTGAIVLLTTVLLVTIGLAGFMGKKFLKTKKRDIVGNPSTATL